jgi:hypothetical protein
MGRLCTHLARSIRVNLYHQRVSMLGREFLQRMGCVGALRGDPVQAVWYGGAVADILTAPAPGTSGDGSTSCGRVCLSYEAITMWPIWNAKSLG